MDDICELVTEAVAVVENGTTFADLAQSLLDCNISVSTWADDDAVASLLAHFRVQQEPQLAWYSERVGGVQWSFGCRESITAATGETRGARAQAYAAAAAVFAIVALIDRQHPSSTAAAQPRAAPSNAAPNQNVSRDVAELAQSVRELREIVAGLAAQPARTPAYGGIRRPRTVGDEADRLVRDAAERSALSTELVRDGMTTKSIRDRYESQSLEKIGAGINATIAAIEALASREGSGTTLGSLSAASILADDWLHDLAVARECALWTLKAVVDRYDRVVIFSIEGQKGVNKLRAAKLRNAPSPLLSAAAVQILGDKKSAEKSETAPSAGSRSSGGPSNRSSAGASASSSSN